MALDADQRAELVATWRAYGGQEVAERPQSTGASGTGKLRSHPGRAIPPNNLPAQITSLIGREHELARVEELLAGTRLLTLTGAGGSGKTRLALQASTDVLEHHTDGVWFVELAPLGQRELVPFTVAATLGVQGEPAQPAQPILRTLLSALASRHLLLVLDNCEHLVHACAELATAILRGCPNVTILATSREALGIAGETTWRVPPLGMADPARLPPVEQLTQFAAVRLFVDRACAARPEFTVTNGNAPAVAQICHRLDGIPLAIELAAARVKVLVPEQIAARLDDRFRLLTSGSRTALPRQQTLRALLDWSYDLLSSLEQTLLQRLSVFAGGWTLEAAEAVCGGEPLTTDEVLDLLSSLVDKSLVFADEQKDGALRYRLPETLRQYAGEKFVDADRERAEEVCGEYFLSQAEDGFKRYWGADVVAWCNWLEQEHDNFRAVLARGHALAECGARAEGQALLAARTAACLMWFWYFRNYWDEGRMWLGSLSRLRGLAADLEGRLLAWHSSLAFYQADIPTADGLVERTLDIAEPAGLRALAAVALCVHAIHSAWVGRLEESRELADRSLSMTLTLDPVEFEAAHLPTREWMIGLLYYARTQRALFEGDLAGAVEVSRLALETVRRLGQPFGITAALSLRGLLATQAQDLTGARADLLEALALARDTAPGQVEADILGRLANVMRLGGNVTDARRLCGQSLALRRKLGHKLGVARDMVALAALELEREPGVATTLLAASQAIVTGLEVRRSEAEQQEFAACERACRAALGDEAFTSAWAAGAALSFADALLYALERTGE